MRSQIVWSCREGILLLAKAWNVHVDSTHKLRFNLVPFDELDKLELFLSGRRVLRTNFPKILVDVVVEGIHT